jgi:hypothetical protein
MRTKGIVSSGLFVFILLMIASEPTRALATNLAECDRFAASPDTFEGWSVISQSGFDPMTAKVGATYEKLNSQRAIPACQQAVSQDPKNGRVWFQLGRAREKGNQIADAILAYERAAQLHSADGLNNLGELYRAGKGVPQDLTKAESLFRQAAQAGSVEATINLINLLVKRPDARVYYDELMTLAALVHPTDVSISPHVLAALAKAELSIPAAVRNETDGPASFIANVSIHISPNTSNGSYCSSVPEGELCVPSGRLNISLMNAQFTRSTPDFLSVSITEIVPNLSLSLIHIPHDIFSIDFLYELSLTLNDITPKDSESSPRPIPLTIGAHFLWKDMQDCWKDEVIRVCLTRP